MPVVPSEIHGNNYARKPRCLILSIRDPAVSCWASPMSPMMTHGDMVYKSCSISGFLVSDECSCKTAAPTRCNAPWWHQFGWLTSELFSTTHCLASRISFLTVEQARIREGFPSWGEHTVSIDDSNVIQQITDKWPEYALHSDRIIRKHYGSIRESSGPYVWCDRNRAGDRYLQWP